MKTQTLGNGTQLVLLWNIGLLRRELFVCVANDTKIRNKKRGLVIVRVFVMMIKGIILSILSLLIQQLLSIRLQNKLVNRTHQLIFSLLQHSYLEGER